MSIGTSWQSVERWLSCFVIVAVCVWVVSADVQLLGETREREREERERESDKREFERETKRGIGRGRWGTKTHTGRQVIPGNTRSGKAGRETRERERETETETHTTSYIYIHIYT